jgi:hypothetical protein
MKCLAGGYGLSALIAYAEAGMPLEGFSVDSENRHTEHKLKAGNFI